MIWNEKSGSNIDVVISSRARIVRNIKGFAFPSKMKQEEKENVISLVRQAMSDTPMRFVSADELNAEAKAQLFKHKVIDKKFLLDDKGKALLLNDDESLSITINQTEHLRITSLCVGSDIIGAYKNAEALALELEKKFDIAYSERLGFLTSSVTNIGSGIELSFDVAIPAIEMSGRLKALSDRISSMQSDWKITPVATAGNRGIGNLYKISNVSTLGIGEEELITHAVRVISDVIKFERMCKTALKNRNSLIVEDRFHKAYAIMSCCKLMNVDEALDNLSWLRFGRYCFEDAIPNLTFNKINDIASRISFEMLISGKNVRPGNEAASAKRATAIREILSKGDDE